MNEITNQCIEIRTVPKYKLEIFLFSDQSFWMKSGFDPIPIPIVLEIMEQLEKEEYVSLLYRSPSPFPLNAHSIERKEIILKSEI